MATPRKYMRGNRIQDASEVIHAPENQYFILSLGTSDCTRHKQVLMNFRVNTLVQFVSHGYVYWAEPIARKGGGSQ